MAFSVWNDKNECLSWSDTVAFLEALGVKSVPVLYEGVYDDAKIKQIAENATRGGAEGVVVRLEDSFSYGDFSLSIAKYVRANHNQTDKSWGKEIKKNTLG